MSLQGRVSFTFYGFDGIDLNFTLKNNSYTHGGSFYFTFAKFDFYLNGKPLKMSSDGGRTCDEAEFNNIVRGYKHQFFGYLEHLDITYEFQSPNSNFEKWCPLIFSNTNITELNLHAKPIRFYAGNYSNLISRITIANFYNLVAENFDREILHPQVYSLLEQIQIVGTVKKIENDVFKEMKFLRWITLQINDLKGFFQGNGIEWINSVNFHIKSLNISTYELKCGLKCLKLLHSSLSWIALDTANHNESQSGISVSQFTKMRLYNFPDEDFCIFSNYPHNRSVLIRVDYILYNCTCTMIWIFKNAALLATHYDQSENYDIAPLSNPCSSLISDFVQFKHAFNACDFPDKYLKCQLNISIPNQSLSSYTDSYFQFYDTQYFLIKMRDILKSYFDYWILVLGFLTNLITAIVIINAYRKASVYSNNKDNQLGSIKENFFTYMLINSIINSIYSLLMFFNETLPCVPNPVGEKYIENNCLITDACIATTASVLKLTANVTYLQMSLNRYLLVGKDHSERLKKVGKANIVIVLIIALITSCLLSYVVVEQQNFLNYFGVQSNGLELNDYYLSIYSDYDKSFFNYGLFVQKFNHKLPLIIPLTIIHDFVSYFLFCILNLIVDVMTVVKLKETLDQKAKIGVQTKEKKEEQESAERRSIIMVVLNSLVNILLRIPELLSIIFFFITITAKDVYMLRVCSHFRECNAVTEISNSFFNLTMIFNIFFYYFFNKTFKFAFHLIFTLNSKTNQTKKLFFFCLILLYLFCAY
jgi:hypothetical protein